MASRLFLPCSYIHSATESIQGIVTKLMQTDNVSMRFSLIGELSYLPGFE